MRNAAAKQSARTYSQQGLRQACPIFSIAAALFRLPLMPAPKAHALAAIAASPKERGQPQESCPVTDPCLT